MSAFKLPRNPGFPIDTTTPTGAARDTAYIAIGTGVLAFQRAKVACRDLGNRLGVAGAGTAADAGRSGLHRLRAQVAHLGELPAVSAVDAKVRVVEHRFDDAFEATAARLPAPARLVMNVVHEAARGSRAHARQTFGLGA